MRRMIMPVVVAAIVSCSPKVRTSFESSYPPLPDDAEVLVLQDTEVPSGAEYIGRVKIGDTGFTTGGTYAAVLSLAKEEARKVGGNILDIRVHKFPDSHSTIHRIDADIFRIIAVH